jgi:hypothetical protein
LPLCVWLEMPLRVLVIDESDSNRRSSYCPSRMSNTKPFWTILSQLEALGCYAWNKLNVLYFTCERTYSYNKNYHATQSPASRHGLTWRLIYIGIRFTWRNTRMRLATVSIPLRPQTPWLVQLDGDDTAIPVDTHRFTFSFALLPCPRLQW